MKQIQLTKGKVAIIDDQDSHLENYKWFCDAAGYAVRNIQMGDKRATVRLHHCIIGFPLNGKEVDHIDGKRINNLRENLRIVTHRENGINRKEHRGEKVVKSPYCGVHKETYANSWYASISIKGKQYRLGSFRTPEQAKEVYEKRSKELIASGL